MATLRRRRSHNYLFLVALLSQAEAGTTSDAVHTSSATSSPPSPLRKTALDNDADDDDNKHYTMFTPNTLKVAAYYGP